MRNKITKIGALAVVIAVATAVAAVAVVTFDPATGKGFVGKGDVQTAFAWNNQQLQKNAAGVTFTYNATDSYEAVCTWVTGEGTKGEQTHNVSHSTSTEVKATIGSEGRDKSSGLNGPNTGFILTGFGKQTESGSVPVVGGPCPGNPGTDAEWTSVTPLGGSGGLFANFGGTAVLIWP